MRTEDFSAIAAETPADTAQQGAELPFYERLYLDATVREQRLETLRRQLEDEELLEQYKQQQENNAAASAERAEITTRDVDLRLFNDSKRRESKMAALRESARLAEKRGFAERRETVLQSGTNDRW